MYLCAIKDVCCEKKLRETAEEERSVPRKTNDYIKVALIQTFSADSLTNFLGESFDEKCFFASFSGDATYKGVK